MSKMGLVVGFGLLAATVASAQESWAVRESSPVTFSRQGLAETGGTIYCYGGTDPSTGNVTAAVYSFDPVTGAWTACADLPAAVTDLGSAAMGGLVYAVGGVDSSNNLLDTVYAYDPSLNTWSPVSSLPAATAQLRCVDAGGRLISLGGRTAAGAVSTVSLLLPGAPAWTPLPSLPVARTSLFCGVDGSRLYAAGGFDALGLATVTTFIFNLISGTWTGGASMPVPAAAGGGAVILNRFFCSGGDGSLTANSEYNPVLDSWTSRSPVPAGLDAGASVAVAGSIFSIGNASDSSVADRMHQYSAPDYGATPGLPALLVQRGVIVQRPVAAGVVVDGTAIQATATLSDADVPAQRVRIEVEIQRADAPFQDWPTQRGDFAPQGVQTLTVDLTVEGSYKWQIRTADETGNASAWVQFGARDGVDFEISSSVPGNGGTIDPSNDLPAAPPVATTETASTPAGKSCNGSATGTNGAASLLLLALLAAAGLRKIA